MVIKMLLMMMNVLAMMMIYDGHNNDNYKCLFIGIVVLNQWCRVYGYQDVINDDECVSNADDIHMYDDHDHDNDIQ